MRLAAQRHTSEKDEPILSRTPAKITKQTKNKITVTKQDIMGAEGLTLLCEGKATSSLLLLWSQLSLSKLTLLKSTLDIIMKELDCSLSMTMVHTMTSKSKCLP